MGVALEARPGAALGVPEVALQAVGLVGVGGDHPAEEDIGRCFVGVLEETLAQVHVVAADRAGDIGLGQADGGLDARRMGKAGEKGRLRRIPLSAERADYFVLVLALVVLEKAESALALKARTRYQ
jgi:hypothetical protein